MRELSEIPEEIKDKLVITPVSTISDVIKAALVRQPEPIKDEDDEQEVPWTPPVMEGETGQGANLPEH